MIVVTVARKPLEASTVASNTLTHGCGALNISASRMATTESLGGGAYSAAGAERHDGAENWRYKRGEQGGLAGQEFKQPPGRWPANIILEHLEGCVRVGEKQVGHGAFVPSDGVVRTSTMMGEDKGWNANSMSNSKKNAPNSYGVETVPAWECVPGCPILALDEQSGVRVGFSGGGAVDNRKFGTEVIPGFNRKSSVPFIRNDTGGAARFFKQVGGK